MTFEKGLTPRQLFFLSAAYMLSGAFIFRTRGVFTLAVSFLLWTVISGATVILKNRKPDILSGGVFSAVLAAFIVHGVGFVGLKIFFACKYRKIRLFKLFGDK